MKAADLDIFVEQGTVFGMSLTFQKADGTALDLTGYSFQGQIRENYSSSQVLANMSCAIPTPSNGTVVISMTDTQTSNIPVDPATSFQKRNTFYCYDIEMRRPDGSHIRVVQGAAEISPEVTR